MLIRLVSHARKGNPNLIDELIRIEGLPEDMLFRFRDGKKYLKSPWEPDADINIPHHIREHCDPMDITVDLPPEKNEVTGVLQRPVDTFRILGVKLVMDNNPGKEMWTQIERILDMATPRDKKVPVPAIVAQNHRDQFFLESKDIPVCDLRPPKMEVPVTVSTAVKVEIPVIPFNPPNVDESVKPVKFTCGVCHKIFGQQRGLWMHERKTRHKAKEPVAV